MRRAVLVAVASMTVVLSGVVVAQAALPQMCGRWTGNADIFVDWTKTRTLPVEIVITPDDSVSGKGAIATSGSKIGDRDTMVFTARVVLHRAPDMVVCEG